MHRKQNRLVSIFISMFVGIVTVIFCEKLAALGVISFNVFLLVIAIFAVIIAILVILYLCS